MTGLTRQFATAARNQTVQATIRDRIARIEVQALAYDRGMAAIQKLKTDPKDEAAESNSPANPSQAAAASSIGTGPAPRYIRAELISGGNTKKLMGHALSEPLVEEARLCVALVEET